MTRPLLTLLATTLVVVAGITLSSVPAAAARQEKGLRRGFEAITRQNAEASLRFLSSGVMRGRLAGSNEGHIAAQYLISELEQMGYGPNEIAVQPFAGRKGEEMRNVLVTIPGRDTVRRLIVGAHFDHEGSKNGVTYPGADDNGSGTVVMLELARAVRAAGVSPAQTLILAFWDGEERGLQGSRHYAGLLGRDTSSVIAYINFDMVGRNTDERRPGLFRYFYTSSTPALRSWYDESVQAGQLTHLEADYRPCDRTIGGSDNTSFARLGIPIVWYHTDGHPDYNQPTDTADRINYPKMLEIARSAWYLIWQMCYIGA